MKLISIQNALEKVIESVPNGKPVSVNSASAVGLHLSQDVIAPIDLPGFNNSAMDGYVFRFEDYDRDTRKFTQQLEVKAGDPIPEALSAGSCYRIFTGAPVPENGTLVVMQEHIKSSGNTIEIDEEGSRLMQNIRLEGEQIKKGQVALKKGSKLTPAALGYLASLGFEKLPVYKSPKVAVLTTGDELVKPGNKLASGQIFESNSAALLGGFSQEGISEVTVRTLPDNFETTKNTIEAQLKTNDFLVLTGGISVGEYDFVGKALKELGVETVFYKVNQKPGKPFYFGKTSTCSVFALPGNPAAVMTCFYYYLRPAIRKFKGASTPKNDCLTLPLKADFKIKGSRDLILKSVISGGSVEVLDGQSSNMMHTFALANSLTLIEAQHGHIQAGERVRVYPI